MEWKEYKVNAVESKMVKIPIYTEEELTERLNQGLPITESEMEEWSEDEDGK